MIYTSYINKLKNIPKDAAKFLIARQPIGEETMKRYNCVHLPYFSPSAELRNSYKNREISYEEFEARLRIELTDIKNAVGVADSLHEIRKCIDESKDIYILCYEKDVTTCHRKIIGELLSKVFKQKCEEAVY